MTIREMNRLLGTQVFVEPIPGLRVACTVTNAKTSYGHPRLEITPQAGSGRAWVGAASVTASGETAQPEGAKHGRA